MRCPEADRGRKTALELAAVTMPVFQRGVGAGWLPALAGGSAAALALTLLRRSLGSRSLGRAADKGLPGRISLWILLISLLGLAAWAGMESTMAFPETAGSPLAAGLILLLAWAAVRRGAEVPGRCAAVLIRLLAVLYGVVLIFSLPQLQVRWLAPVWSWQGCLTCFGLLLLPGAGLCLEQSGRTRFPASLWLAAGVGTVGAAVTAGILSPSLAAEPMAFHTLARSVSILGVMQRFEALISGAQLISGFCLCSLLLGAARSLLESLQGKGRAVRIFPALLPVLAAIAAVPGGADGRLWGLTAICGGGAAISLLFVDPKKILEKNEKMLDKSGG